jgi:hypothetical protein
VWVDDERFDITRHVRRAAPTSLGELAGSVLSTPLGRDGYLTPRPVRAAGL